jgi:hypothetical protein
MALQALRFGFSRICYNSFFTDSHAFKRIANLHPSRDSRAEIPRMMGAKPRVIPMVEFTSEPQRTFPFVKLLVALGACVVLLAGVFLFIRYQRAVPAQAGSANVVVPGLLRPGNTDFEYYKNRIRIEDAKATLGVSFANARIAIISGIIVNDGSRKLEALELHITLYDMWGKFSKERTAFALRPGAGFNKKPMEPLEKRAFTIGIESVEYYWNPKQIAYEITGLKFK